MTMTMLDAGPELDRAVCEALHLNPEEGTPWSTDPECGERLVTLLHDLGIEARAQVGAAGVTATLLRPNGRKQPPTTLASALERFQPRKEWDLEEIERRGQLALAAALCRAVVKWGGE